ncbi:MAG: DUF1080 domain-containing protein [Halieaceae bacterium]
MNLRILIPLLPLLITACSEPPMDVAPGECVNALTGEEASQGWRLLFDGESLEHWRSHGQAEVGAGWGIQSGCLAWQELDADLITREQFADFELKLDWRISEGGNSGIFIRAEESEQGIPATGMEMQVLDNVGHWDRHWDSHRAGAYYDMIAPAFDTTVPVGQWNAVHIIAHGPQVEFWLNDRLTARFEQMSPEWEALLAESKFAGRPRYGRLLEGHIALQDHWNRVLYRNIRIRVID